MTLTLLPITETRRAPVPPVRTAGRGRAPAPSLDPSRGRPGWPLWAVKVLDLSVPVPGTHRLAHEVRVRQINMPEAIAAALRQVRNGHADPVAVRALTCRKVEG